MGDRLEIVKLGGVQAGQLIRQADHRCSVPGRSSCRARFKDPDCWQDLCRSRLGSLWFWSPRRSWERSPRR